VNFYTTRTHLLIGPLIDTVFAGYRVNVDSHRNLLEACRKQGSKRTGGNKIIYVYTSGEPSLCATATTPDPVFAHRRSSFPGLAVFGGDKCKPEAFVDPMVHPFRAASSLASYAT
jgi:nucleoside-diphosphate-sugar epimerase